MAMCCGHVGFDPAHPNMVAEKNSRQHRLKSMSETQTRVQPDTWRVQENSRWEMLSIKDTLAPLENSDSLPSVEGFICILQKCRENKSLAHADCTFLNIHKNGLEAHSALGNYLVPLFVECGRFSVAQRVFYRLVHPNEHSWTSLIQGYIECGNYQHALNVYQKMQESCVHPSKHTFVALLKACARLKHINRGQQIFGEIVKEGFERDPFVGNILVDMYAKCSLLMEAQDVFHEVSVRNVVSWTALIAGYVEHGLGKEAADYFEQMQAEGVSPNAVTFVCVLKSCTGIGAADKAQEIHADIIKKGFETDLLVGNSLVDMYARFSLLAEAQEVFDDLPIRDVISWTALMAGHAEHGLEEEALIFLEQMQLEGIVPNAITFVCALQACGSIGAGDKGQDIHTKVMKEGLEEDPLMGSTLVDMYASCGLLAEAQDVFDELPARDVVLWTALIAGYAEHGLGEEVLLCLDQMQREGVSLDAFTIACSLRACGSIGAINRGREFHAEIIREGFEEDPFVGNSLVDMYAKCSLMLEAREVFDELLVQDVVSWNALLTGYAELGYGEEALNCLEMMGLEGMYQDAVTVVCSLKACGNAGAIDKGREIHAGIAREGFESNQLVGSLLVALYGKCDALVEAQEMFDELLVRDVVSWTGLITGYAEYGFAEEALRYLEYMQMEGVSPDVVTWSAVIAGYNKQGESEKALTLYTQMQEQGLLPNSVTFVSVLKACGKTVALDRGRKAHSQMSGVELEEAIDLTIMAALVDMYSKCGSMVDAQKVFDAVPTRNLFKWNALITGLARQGESELVFQMLDGMRQVGIQPNGITFLNALTVCSHAGLLDRGLQYFEAMVEEYSITPTLKHYSCMVDLLSRAGRLVEAVAMLKKMPFQPDFVMWNTVLAACWKRGNVEMGKQAFECAVSQMGKQAFECAVRSDGKHAAAFTLMSNIYADADMPDDARKIKAMILNT